VSETAKPEPSKPEPSKPEPERLDAALRAAFRAPQGGGTPAASVMARLFGEGSGSPTLRLREEGSEDAPVLLPRGAGSEGRYQVTGEIARGGVGVILKGHDVDLGRDVAMKVVRKEHAGNPEVLQRFVEEAQIGGQLQHPGIVPVYEMGLRSDQRPYFTMKLVKGRTLAALLLERKEAPAERRRFLSIFESVCQTMAYAHARGVIHRDLKPANVMVGAFGEVLVVDWGMAKVLRQGGTADEKRAKKAASPDVSLIQTVRSEGSGSESQAGSVLGTPRYMSPEQAMGDVEHLDERADVFALGALLCEVLTGKAPYEGDEGAALLQAARGKLERAHERLERCGADAELVELAKACLSPSREARPKDAGAVAREVGAYLASVEERAKEATLQAAEARGKAVEERRRRKVTLALAGSVVALLLLGGGGWLWVTAERRKRADEADRLVAQALDEATALRRKATASDPSSFGEALSVARRAVALAESKDAAETTRARARGAVAALEADERAAREALERQALHDRTVAALEAIRLEHVDRMQPAVAEARYEEVFREAGIDLGRGDVRDVARRIADSGSLRDPLIAALYDLWGLRRVLRSPDADRTAALLDAADPDPWRARLRAPSTTLDELRALAREADVASTPNQGFRVLVARLAEGGDLPGAFDVARRVQEANPGELWANLAAGSLAGALTPPRPVDGLRYMAAAAALRPEAPEIRHVIAILLKHKGDVEASLAMMREAVRLRPENAALHADLGTLLAQAGQLDAGIAELQEAVRLAPESPDHPWNLGHAFWGAGRYAEAARAMRRAHELGMTDRPAEALAREFERLARLAPRLDAVLAGADVPADARETIDFAGIAAGRGLAAGAATLFRRGLEADPSLAKTPLWPYRYNAACAAALAGTGRGKDAASLDEAARAAWRRQSLEWLRADLAARRERADSDPRAFFEALGWRTDPDLAGVRDEASLAKLPAEEGDSFRAFWRDVDAIAEAAAPRPPPSASGR
jgi:serine/threonine-protein kinase